AGLTLNEIDQVIFHDKPSVKLERLLQKHIPSTRAALRSQIISVPRWIKRNVHRPYHIWRAFGPQFTRSLTFAEHDQAQAACAFFPSPFEEAAILVMDNAGGRGAAKIGLGRANKIELLDSIECPPSLPLLSKAFASFCGFEGN